MSHDLPLLSNQPKKSNDVEMKHASLDGLTIEKRKNQSEIERTFWCITSKIWCLPICFYNECIRIGVEKCTENTQYPISPLQGKYNEHVCMCCYKREKNYTSTQCCCDLYGYDPCGEIQ
jgi:hypothetical protein